MANYTYTDSQSQIQFTNVKRNAASIASVPLSSKNNYVISDSTITEKYDNVINAIDIDWNTAKLEDAITALSANVQEGVAVSNITTTGELIKVVAQLQAQVNVLTNLVKGLYATLAS